MKYMSRRCKKYISNTEGLLHCLQKSEFQSVLPCPESISGAEVSALFIKACLSCAACCLSISYMYSSPLFFAANCTSMIRESTYNCISTRNAFRISNLTPRRQKKTKEGVQRKTFRQFSEPAPVQKLLAPAISIIRLFLSGTSAPRINVIDLIAIYSLEL